MSTNKADHFNDISCSESMVDEFVCSRCGQVLDYFRLLLHQAIDHSARKGFLSENFSSKWETVVVTPA